MNRFAFLCVVISVTLTLSCAVNAATPPTDVSVWHWYSKCSSRKKIVAEVIFERQRIYKTSFNICHLPRGSIEPENPQRILEFKLISSRRSLFGERKGEYLEGNFWEAAEDQDVLILGVSFMGPKRVWLNSLHVLYPDKLSETRLVRGLVVRTYPSAEHKVIN